MLCILILTLATNSIFIPGNIFPDSVANYLGKNYYDHDFAKKRSEMSKCNTIPYVVSVNGQCEKHKTDRHLCSQMYQYSWPRGNRVRESDDSTSLNMSLKNASDKCLNAYTGKAFFKKMGGHHSVT